MVLLAKSDLFLCACSACGLPAPKAEFRFHAKRKWRFDFAWPAPDLVALEVEGGIFSGGRHTRGAGFAKDMEKYNEATAMGWRLLRVTPSELMTAYTFDLIRRALQCGR
jgi:hypothetical protein